MCVAGTCIITRSEPDIFTRGPTNRFPLRRTTIFILCCGTSNATPSDRRWSSDPSSGVGVVCGAHSTRPLPLANSPPGELARPSESCFNEKGARSRVDIRPMWSPLWIRVLARSHGEATWPRIHISNTWSAAKSQWRNDEVKPTADLIGRIPFSFPFHFQSRILRSGPGKSVVRLDPAQASTE